jgi:hypothetical protein
MMSDLRPRHEFALGMQLSLDYRPHHQSDTLGDDSEMADSCGSAPIPAGIAYRPSPPQQPQTLMNALSSKRMQLQTMLQQRRQRSSEQRGVSSNLPDEKLSQQHHLSASLSSPRSNLVPRETSSQTTSDMIRQEVACAFRMSESSKTIQTNLQQHRNNHQQSTLRQSRSESAVSSTQQNASFKRRSPTNDQLSLPATLSSGSLTDNPHKKQKRVMSDSLLHHSCKLFSQDPNIIESALQLDPDAIRYESPMVCLGNAGSTSPTAAAAGQAAANCKPFFVERPSTFKYAINIALKYNASPKVLEILAKAGPDVCMEGDGPMESGSLSIALETTAGATAKAATADATTLTTSKTDDIVDVLLLANPQCATVLDRHYNTPLHCAARLRHVSVTTVAKIHRAHPAAVTLRNFHGFTPLQVAQRSLCNEEVLAYLQKLDHCKQDDTLKKGLDNFDRLLRLDSDTDEAESNEDW